ncbi:MAG: heme exporter protein CcmD [Gammaproteobacteria bacterium]|jgi:heme exporter protein D|nr:heme exporter protein CcmD [Gammaproteobacteria bacterium]MBU0772839.1 heme exporter protein CcmD [Gammaproteobacteria bacterium]MBU0856573.1 heme exporter protein CcmD [Gammaproteobacteria bacterium]MBU1847533.1 heme exporter protein CcmD [Gammaproteobacteria bacterium]
MNWESASDFWHMGGYGFYVWGSYAVTAVLLAFEVWAVARRGRLARVRVARDVAVERMDERRREPT